ncbi:MAG TPA: Asp-tRNA(Asn)/Glu-tRNA(Gln) amidotransferase subunit GatB [candidate division Zixibacteria bacterium]|nr:Asp-tRNA(Asn)/Glu-tRNA(Gln) amidotransferase subunit GatB [candidate division Zixibacteria bacterium]
MKYESIIGLEVHAQLLTDSKIFCGCSASYGADPNSQTCPVCLGLPGVLPVLNKKVVEYAVRMVLAVEGTVAQHSVFARKNYFYPDLPKGYQISQYDQPLSSGGSVEIEIPESKAKKKINLTRIHLEEDAGKSLHSEDNSYTSTSSNVKQKGETLVDMNRCGVPLIEIVSQPDMRSSKEATLFLNKLKQILEYLEICSGNMEEGSLRCDANVSVRPVSQQKLGTKTELKNMNSFKAVEKALNFEIERQIGIIESGGRITQETLLWDVEKEEIAPMRSKEESHDYRYFPEPDLVVLNVGKNWIEEIRKNLPELPEARKNRFVKQYQIPEYDAELLTTEKKLADYYEKCVKNYPNPKTVSNWVMGEVLRGLKERRMSVSEFKVSPKELASLLKQVDSGTLSGKMAKDVFVEMAETGKSAEKIIQEKGLVQVTDTKEIESVIESVLKENPQEVDKYKSGKERVFGFFVGEVMKKTKGKANPALVNQILKQKLSNGYTIP